jgi:hypothetical protein
MADEERDIYAFNGAWCLGFGTIDMPTCLLRLRLFMARGFSTTLWDWTSNGLVVASIGPVTTCLCRHTLSLWTTILRLILLDLPMRHRGVCKRLHAGFDISSSSRRNCMDDRQARSYRNTRRRQHQHRYQAYFTSSSKWGLYHYYCMATSAKVARWIWSHCSRQPPMTAIESVVELSEQLVRPAANGSSVEAANG